MFFGFFFPLGEEREGTAGDAESEEVGEGGAKEEGVE